MFRIWMILVDLLGLPAFGQELPADAKGCKDSALLSRVSGCYVSSCKRNDWDEVEIAVAQGKTQKVEGQMEEIYYQCSADYSRLKVVRNAETALRQAGYTMVFQGTYDGDPAVTARLGPQWVFVYTGNGRYWVRTVKAKEMAQEMKATAEAMASGIAATGHFAVYGIYFDTDKADIKPESEPALKETVRLLQQAPKLNVFIVGHTDNTGDYLRNMKLSEARANAVAAALTAKHGIAATRLKAAGVGPVAPVAPNKTEEGRAKNRRVELVER